ncbi:hypothetical protein EON65_06465 [archaeon]|nr:MAG: hypothetical protein EON65_06465 [archaeon]
MTSRGHELSYKFADAQDLELQKYGEYLYDNVIIFAPKASSFGSLSAEDILEFVRSGHNLIVAAYRETGEGIRAIAEQVGVDLDPKGTEVIDHLEKIDELDSTRQHTVFLARETISSPSILGDFNQQSSKYPVMFRGIGHKIAKDNILAVRILRGNPTSYSFFPNKAINDSPLTMGEDTLLVSAIQGRNNARVLVAGSLDMFSNAFFAFNDGGMQTGNNTANIFVFICPSCMVQLYPSTHFVFYINDTGNRKFCAEISKWALGEQGVLRYRNITHHKSDGTPPDVTLHEKARPDLPITLYPDPEIARNSLVSHMNTCHIYMYKITP